MMLLTYRKDVTIYADDTQEAEEKAIDMCTDWTNVVTAEVEDIVEPNEVY
jgi:hypothetical protein